MDNIGAVFISGACPFGRDTTGPSAARAWDSMARAPYCRFAPYQSNVSAGGAVWTSSMCVLSLWRPGLTTA